MAYLPQVDERPKDKKVAFFRIETSGNSAEGTNKHRTYLKDTAGNKLLFWAYYRSLSGSEYFSANATQVRATAQFIVNFNTEISEDMFIEFRGKVYGIAYIDDLEGYRGDLKIMTNLTQEANGIE